MDGESVRSGRSEKSDRSRRSKRIQRTNNVPSNQSACMFQEQLKGVTASSQNQQLIVDQNMQSIDSSIRQSSQNTLMPVVQQQHMNIFAQQTMGLQQNNPHPYTLETWIPPLMPVNPNFSACSQSNMFVPNAQSWGAQAVPQVYTQQMIPQSIPAPFPRPPNCAGVQSSQIHPQQQQQVGHFMPTGQQHPLAHTAPSHVPSSQPSSQIPEPYRSERFDSQLTHQDESAWVEEATAVTGATSETGLSGDNFSRFGARYGLATSLGINSNGGAGCNISGAAAALIRSEADEIKVFKCSNTLSFAISAFLGIASLVSPILMLLLPFLPFWIGWSTDTCQPTCEGNLISISVKLVLLSIALWFLSSPCQPFCGSGTAILPRIRLCRTLFLCLVLVVLFAFWLFYTVRVIQPKESDYLSIVVFASSLTDTLLFLHYAAIALMELRKIRFHYVIHIVRSPDGMSKTFKCGEMSLQRAAVEVLQFYMLEFTAYNPNQNPVNSGGGGKRSRRGGSASAGNGGGSKYKFYDVDSGGAGLNKSENGVTYTVEQSAGAITAPSASVRLYEEIELEKRIRKRRMRLLLAVEEAFTHVKRLAAENCNNRGSVVGVVECDQTLVLFKNSRSNGRMSKLSCSTGKSLDPYEAAQAVFPTLIRPLQKYMRVTRQQARHPVDMVIDHLALCLAYGLSPHAFLERFNPSAATPQQDAAAAATAIATAKRAKHQQSAKQVNNVPDNSDPSPLLPKYVHPGGQQIWSIVADRALSRSLADGAIFQLRRGSELSLLCTVRRLPLIYLIEEILEPLEAGRFVLRTDNAV